MVSVKSDIGDLIEITANRQPYISVLLWEKKNILVIGYSRIKLVILEKEFASETLVKVDKRPRSSRCTFWCTNEDFLCSLRV